MADLTQFTHLFGDLIRHMHMPSHNNRPLLHPIGLDPARLEPLSLYLKDHFNEKDTP